MTFFRAPKTETAPAAITWWLGSFVCGYGLS